MMGIIKTKSLPLIKKLGGRGAALLLGLVMAVPAFAATRDNGCGDPDNVYINPELALCSVHAYNIGFTNNPNSSSADSQIMRDVVALKTTVMMQQMYKQYSFLEATINRIKTQLKREILTTQAEAAGAPSGGSSGASSSVGGNNGVSGAENCRTAGSTADVMSCLSRNVDRIATAISNSDIGAARRQIDTDLQTLKLYDSLEKGADDPTTETPDESMSQPLSTAYTKCKSANTNRQKMLECVDFIRVCITRNIEYLQNQNRNVYNPFTR